MSKNINSDERRTEIAPARYTLILPIVRETCRRRRHQMRNASVLRPQSTTFLLG